MKTKKNIRVFLKRFLLIALILQGGVGLKPANLFAQQQYDIKLGWENQTACSIYDDRKEGENLSLLEDLEETDCIRVCEGAEAHYWVAGSDVGNISSVDWSVIGGNYTTQPGGLGIDVDWNNAGANAMVHMAVTMNDGTVVEGGLCVETLDKPTAKFMIPPQPDNANACVNQEVFFTNLSYSNSGGQLVAFHWDFGDGNTSTAFEPVHTYTSAGTYTVTLTVWNECNCFDKYEIKITVKDWGAPPEISCPTVTCENSVERYEAISEGCDNFKWEIAGGTILSGQGSPSIEVQWDDVDPHTGFGWINLTEECEGVCPTPTKAKVPVILEKIPIQGDATVCRDSQHRYSIPKWPTTEIEWVLTDMGGADYSQYLTYSTQRNEILVTPNANLPLGQYTLKAIYNNTLKQCSGVGEIIINLLGEPHEITGPKQICIEEEVEYTTVDPLSNTQWTLKNNAGQVVTTQTGADFIFSFSNPGNYLLIANHPNRCPGEPYTILVQDPPSTPQGDFDLPEEVCPGMTYAIGFTNTDSGINPEDYIIEWGIENGEITGNPTGDETEVVFDSSPSGNYTVSVQYTMKNNPFCPSEPLVSDVIPLIEVNTEIEHYEPSSGNVLNNTTFCTSTEAHFKVDELEGDIYEWEFSPSNFGSIVQGQNTPEVLVNIHEISQGVTTGSLSLRVQRCGEWFDIDAYEIEKTESPIISWNPPTEVCADESFTINFSASIGSQQLGSFDQATLDFGNGQVFTSPVSTGAFQWAFHNLSYDNIVNGPTNYNMTLTLEGPDGCTQAAFESHQITVIPTPVATISASDPTVTYCEASDIPSNLILTATETGGIVNVSSWQWSRNGNEIAGATGVTYQVTQFGNYTVKAIGTNDCEGYSSSYSIRQKNCDGGGNVCDEEIEITDTSWTDCDIVEVDFNYSTVPNQINWSVEPATGLDFVSSSGTTAIFESTLPGNYSITAHASWSCGSKRVSETVLVAHQVQLDYSISCNTIIGGYDVTLHNDSPYVSGHVPDETIFYVDSGATSFSNYEDEITVNVPAGLHTFQLEIGNNASNFPSCTSDLITVDLTSPTAEFSIPSEVCEGEPITLIPDTSSLGPGYTYLWDFNGTTDVREQVEVTLEASSLMLVSLVVTDPWGCSAEFTNPISVNAPNFIGEITGHEGPVCKGETVTLSYDPLGGNLPVTYQWVFNGNEITGATNPTFETTVPGLYNLLLTNSDGCSAWLDEPVSVNFTSPPEVLISGPVQACEGETYSLSGFTSNEEVSRRWLRNGSSITPWSVNTPLEIEDTPTNYGIYTYTLEVGGDCPNETDFTVEVFPSPEPGGVGVDVAFQVTCDPFEVTMTITNPDPNGTYSWTNGDAGIQTTIYRSGRLGVTYTNENGCSTTKEIQVPQFPDEHLWVFPTGCIEACERQKINTSYVIGPLPDFHAYTWLWNTSGTPGSGMVPPEDIYPMGDLQLQLDTNLFGTICEQISDPLNVSYASGAGCEPCEQELEIKIGDIHPGNNYPFLSYNVHLILNNPYPFPLTFQLSSPDGVYVPGSITLGGGQTQAFMVDFIPNTGFSGGSSNLSVQVLRSGQLFCQQSKTLNFPPAPLPKMPKNTRVGSIFSLSPNPADYKTTVSYDIGKPSVSGGTATLYSLTGVALRKVELSNNQGQIDIDLSGLSSGTYIVLLQSKDGYKTQELLIKK